MTVVVWLFASRCLACGCTAPQSLVFRLWGRSLICDLRANKQQKGNAKKRKQNRRDEKRKLIDIGKS
jgi:hypothetical protein